MLISYNWLKMYFDTPIPSAEDIAHKLTFHAFEIEGLTKKGDNTVIDVKILPDRAHYCLSHRGVAGEVSAVFGIPLKPTTKPVFTESKVRPLSVKIENENLCRRYMARVLENVTITASPEWLVKDLSDIEQRSINIVVDNANGAMFDTGQPLHAFDADKVVGGIVVRLAKAGEKIVTLDGKNIALDTDTLVIADDVGPLAIAGIKGGKRAEVTTATRNIILESANFEPKNIRKTSTRLGIRTDASKRYENEITPELCEHGLDMFVLFIQMTAKESEIKIGSVTDVYPKKWEARTISFDPTLASRLLGISISTEKVIELLKRLDIGVTEKGAVLALAIPAVRLDLEIPEDIVEEIARLYGYENIQPVPLPTLGREVAINKNFYYQNKIRKILTDLGYTEVYTYAFQNSGEVEVANPLASDKAFMRKDLTALQNALEQNMKNAPLIGATDIRLFEIGKVFAKDMSERTILGIGFLPVQKKKQKEIIDAELMKVSGALKDFVSMESFIKTGNQFVVEFDLDACIKNLSEPKTYDLSPIDQNLSYHKPSPFPFIIRDVALFVPPTANRDDVSALIKKEAGSLCVVGPTLFDVYEKKNAEGTIERVSLAYRLIFQSTERTLTDAEVNIAMEGVYNALKKQGFEVRE